MRKNDMEAPANFMDEFVNLSIHKSEFDLLTPEERKFLEEFRSIEYYPDGKKNGQEFDKVEEFFRVLENMKNLRDANKDEESNAECICIDFMVELLSKMSLEEFRKIKIERLLS
jgi:hypothetical protein